MTPIGSLLDGTANIAKFVVVGRPGLPLIAAVHQNLIQRTTIAFYQHQKYV